LGLIKCSHFKIFIQMMI